MDDDHRSTDHHNHRSTDYDYLAADLLDDLDACYVDIDQLAHHDIILDDDVPRLRPLDDDPPNYDDT